MRANIKSSENRRHYQTIKSLANATLMLLVTLTAPIMANAAIVNSFSDRSNWESAVGSTNIDTEFFSVDSTRQLQEGTVEDVGLFNVFYSTANNTSYAENRIQDSSGAVAGGLLDGDYLSLRYREDGSNATTDLQFRFDTSITGLGINLVSVKNDSNLTIELGGGGDGSINVDTFISGTSTQGFVGLISDTPFSFLRFTMSGASGAVDDSFFIDTVSLASTPVPLPGAVWLVGSGLLGLMGLSRRKAMPMGKTVAG